MGQGHKALKAWVARDENGMLYLYLAKPKKYKSKWYPNIRSDYFEIDRKFFPEVKWEDEEPTELTFTLRSKVKNETEINTESMGGKGL